MPRDKGFATADLDVTYYDDVKLKRLWRELHDAALMAQAVVLHNATILESWATGDRVSVREAAPVWLDVSDALVTALVTAQLLDVDEKLPRKTWSSWFLPALKRRADRIKAGQKGGKTKAENARATPEQTSSDATAPLDEVASTALPDPSIPSVPSRPTTPSDPSEPEGDVLSWLARHKVYLPPNGNALHQRLIRLVEQHGAPRVIVEMERLQPQNEAGQYVFGASNALNPIPSVPRPVTTKPKGFLPEDVSNVGR